MKQTRVPVLSLVTALLATGCAETTQPQMRRPADEYVARLRADQARQEAVRAGRTPMGFQSVNSWQAPLAVQIPAAMAPVGATPADMRVSADARARIHLAGGELGADEQYTMPSDNGSGVITNLSGSDVSDQRVDEILEAARRQANIRDYVGPLNLGDPGVSASLWKESRGGNDLFRDYRAFQPMDLITIVINESTAGKKEGTTEVTQESSFSAAIRNLLGIENWNQLDVFDSADGETGDGADLSNLVRATTASEFKGDGETERKGRLSGKISAMIAEVLPSGIMRIEGEKIISLNSEEEVMVISGLIRPEDVNSENEVDSSKIANVRIDYYGNGTIGDAQRGGWLGRFFRRWWPF